jgi:hypothetical protein
MNSVVVFRGVVKTIFLEKEVLKCQHQTKNFPIILDVNTYRDIIEDTSRTNATAKQSTFEIISCAKTLDGNISGCASKEPPRDLPGLLNCSNSQQSASTLPIEMNTVIANGRVKTIEAEKEIFNCLLASNNVPVIKEVTLFIEKFESFDGPTLYNKTNSFEYSTCIKNVSNATVLGCNSQAIK